MSATLLIIIITAIISIYAWNNQQFYGKWMFNPYLAWHRKEYFRFLTSGFVHANYIHLIINLLTFFFFAPHVEHIYERLYPGYGMVLFGGLYFSAIILSEIPTLYRHKDQPGYNSVGASGGVAAVVFASILFKPLNKICLYFMLCLPGFILGALFLVYSYYQSKRMADNINHDAHFYGAIYGIIYSIILYPDVITHFINELSQWSAF